MDAQAGSPKSMMCNMKITIDHTHSRIRIWVFRIIASQTLYIYCIRNNLNEGRNQRVAKIIQTINEPFINKFKFIIIKFTAQTHMRNTLFNLGSEAYKQQFGHQLGLQNSDFNAQLDNYMSKSMGGMSAQQKSLQFRSVARTKHIQGIKKAVRFNWNAEQTLRYLRTVSDKVVQSEQILNEAIQFENIQFLVELIVPADPFFRTAVIEKSSKIVRLIQNNLSKPSSILLLGNLCYLYQQFIHLFLQRDLLTNLMVLMSDMKSNAQCSQIYCWALTKLARQPALLSQNQVYNCLSHLYQSVSQIYPPKQQTRSLFTHLCRLVSLFSNVVTFPDQFLSYLLTIQPNRQVDKQNILIALQNQIKAFKYCQNSPFRIRIIEYLLLLHESCYDKLPKTKKNLVYGLISIVVSRSEAQVSDFIAANKFDDILGNYKYGKIQYYKMIQEILLKLNNINEEQLLQKMIASGLIENLINDITDPNTQIGYMCLRNIIIITKQVKSNGNTKYLQWILNLGLQSQVEQFLDNVKNNDKVAKAAESFLDMIYSQ